MNHIFPLNQGYKIDLRTKGGGETNGVIDIYAWVRGNAAVAAHFVPILQILMIEQATTEQPGGSRVPTKNNFDRVFFGDGGPDRLDVKILCTMGFDVLVEEEEDDGGRRKSTKKGGVESSLRGGGMVDKWVSLREVVGENWIARFLDSCRRV